MSDEDERRLERDGDAAAAARLRLRSGRCPLCGVRPVNDGWAGKAPACCCATCGTTSPRTTFTADPEEAKVKRYASFCSKCPLAPTDQRAVDPLVVDCHFRLALGWGK